MLTRPSAPAADAGATRRHFPLAGGWPVTVAGPLVALMIAVPSLPLGRAAGSLAALMAGMDLGSGDVAAVLGALARLPGYGAALSASVSDPEPSVVYADSSPPYAEPNAAPLAVPTLVPFGAVTGTAVPDGPLTVTVLPCT